MKTRLLALAAVLSVSTPLLRATEIEMKIDLAGTERTVVIRLDETVAPKTCANFAKLCRENFYRGVSAHRVIPNYIVQTGDPLSKEPVKRSEWGTGGPGYTIPAELGGKHVRGAVAAARLGDKANPERASSGSQFYVVLRDIPQLDGLYTVFGTVVSGLETFDEIASAPADDVKVPTVPISFVSSRVLGEDSPTPVQKTPGEMKPAPVPAVAENGAEKPKEPIASTATAAVLGEKTATSSQKSVGELIAKKPDSEPAVAKPAPVMAATAGNDVEKPKEPIAATAMAAVSGEKTVAPPKVAPLETIVAKSDPKPAESKVAFAEPDPLSAQPEPDEEKPLAPMSKLTLNDTAAPSTLPEPPVPPAQTPPASSNSASAIQAEPDPLGASADSQTEIKKEPTISDLATDTMRVNGDRGLPPVRLEANQEALARATDSISPLNGNKKASGPDDGFVPLSSVGNLGGFSWQSAPSEAAHPVKSVSPPAPLESVPGSGFSFASSEGSDFKPKDAKPEPQPDTERTPSPASESEVPKTKQKPKAPKSDTEAQPPALKEPVSDPSGFQPLASGSEPDASQPTSPPAEATPLAPVSAEQERPKGFIGRFIRRVW